MIVNLCANVTLSAKPKDHQWYLDTAATVHMTHDICLYVNSNLDQIQESANGQQFQAKRSGTIALETMIDGKSSYVHLRNVHYCPELDSNLLSLGVLEKNGFKFVGKQRFLSVIDHQGDMVLQAKRRGTVYPLLQPNIQQIKSLNNPIFKVTKLVIQKDWYPRKVYYDRDKSASLPEVTKKSEPVGVDITEPFPPVGKLTQPGLPKDQDIIIGKPESQNSKVKLLTQNNQTSQTRRQENKKTLGLRCREYGDTKNMHGWSIESNTTASGG